MKENGHRIKIFWKEGCSKCSSTKALGQTLEKEGLQIEYYNTLEVKGLTEAVVFEVMSLPSVVIADSKNKEVIGWRGKTPSAKEIKNHL